MDNDRSLKIAIFTDTYHPAVDGVVKYIDNIRNELESRGHEVYVFAAGNRATKELSNADKKLFVFYGINFRKYKQYTLAANPILTRIVGKIKPDLIHSQTPFSMGLLGLIASRRYKIKMLSTFHTFINSDELIEKYLNKNKALLRISKRLLVQYMRYFYSRNSIVIAPSEYSKRILSRIGVKNVVVVPNGVNPPSEISKSYARRKFGIRPKERIILYMGRIGHEKNLNFLVSVSDKIAELGATLVIGGSGPALSELEDYVSKNRLPNIKFLGFVSESEKNAYYKAADVFVNPSNIEILSTVDIEAMVNGTPILVPAMTSQEEFLRKGKCGEKFNQNDPDDFIRKLKIMFRNLDKYNPQRCAKEYSIKNSVDRLLEVYYSLLKEDVRTS